MNNTPFTKRSRRKAFTLIELLVVIVVVALLGALIFPGVIGARENANIAACSGNLKHIGLAIHSYYAGKGQRKFYPRYSPKDGEIMIGGFHHHNSNSIGEKFVECFYMGVKPTLDNSDILACPSTPEYNPNIFNISTTAPYNFDIGQTGYLFRDTEKFPLRMISQNLTGIPVACDRAGNHNRGFNVLFGDGHTDFYDYDSAPFGFADDSDPHSPLKDQPADGTGKTKGNDYLVE